MVLMKKVLALAAGVLAAMIVAGQWPDIKRYVKIKQMSYGSGHPENVPAHGRTSYPSRPDAAAAEGTGLHKRRRSAEDWEETAKGSLARSLTAWGEGPPI